MNWQLGKLTGTKDSIKSKVTAVEGIPQTVKDFILSEIAGVSGESSIVTVTGYSADHTSPLHSSAVTRNIQITISSAAI